MGLYLSPRREANLTKLQYGSVTNEADGSAGNAAVLRDQEAKVPKAKKTHAPKLKSKDQISHVKTHDNPKQHKPVSKIKKASDPAKLKKESTVRIGFRRSLREADVRSDQGQVGNKFSVILIQEGLGNLKDCFYYTKESLQVSASQFEGVKCFADHANAIEEQVHPERSTRDILGHFEDVHYVESDGRGALAATLILCEGDHFDWAKSLLTNSLEYAHKYPNGDFVGLSINASGEAGEMPIEAALAGDISDDVRAKLLDAQSQGIEEIRPVSILKEAVSCDLVTEPGAGGKILAMMERNKKPMKKRKSTEAQESKKKVKAAAVETKEAKQAQEEAEEGHEESHEDGDGAVGGDSDAGADDGDGDADHADAAQDVALFKKMIQQYLGDGAGDVDGEEAMKMAQHAHEHYMKQGMESHEAYEAAGKHLQAAQAIGKAMMGDSEEEEEEEAHEAGHEEEEEAHEESQDPPPAPKASTKGAAPMPQEAKRMLTKANAEIARLRESVSRMEVQTYLDKKLAKLASERSPEFMKKLREAIGKPSTRAQIEETCAMFIKAYEAGREETEESETIFTEKAAYAGASSEGLASGGFGDCVQ